MSCLEVGIPWLLELALSMLLCKLVIIIILAKKFSSKLQAYNLLLLPVVNKVFENIIIINFILL